MAAARLFHSHTHRGMDLFLYHFRCTRQLVVLQVRGHTRCDLREMQREICTDQTPSVTADALKAVFILAQLDRFDDGVRLCVYRDNSNESHHHGNTNGADPS